MEVLKKIYEFFKDLHQGFIFNMFWHGKGYGGIGGIAFFFVFAFSFASFYGLMPILAYISDNIGKEGETLSSLLCIISIGYILSVGCVVYRLSKPSYVLRIAKMRRYNTKRYRTIYPLYYIAFTVGILFFFGALPLLIEIKLLSLLGG